MTARRWIQLGGWAGILSLVLTLAGEIPFVSDADTLVNAPLSTLVEYYSSHANQVITGVIILALASVLFMWFFGAAYQWLRAAGAADDPLPAVLLASGSVVTALFLVERVPQAMLALMAGQAGGLSPDPSVRALADMQAVLTSAVLLAWTVVALSLSFALVRRGVVSAWLAWVGVVSAALFLGTGVASYAVIGNDSLDLPLHLADFGLAVVVVVACVRMIRWQSEPTPVPPSGAATAAM
jgi:hypothetical protein